MQIDRQTLTERERERERQTHMGAHTIRIHILPKTQTHINTHRQTERETKRETERQRDRETETETETERERERESKPGRAAALRSTPEPEAPPRVQILPGTGSSARTRVTHGKRPKLRRRHEHSTRTRNHPPSLFPLV